MGFKTALAFSIIAAVGCTGGNSPPVLSALDARQIKVGARERLSVDATDADGDHITFSFGLTLFPGQPKETTYTNPALLPTGIEWSAGGTNAFLQWAPSNNQVGRDHRLTIIADDGNGGTDEETTTITVFPSEVADGNADPGSPRFVFHANLVLDLVRTLCLKARIRVEDPDSSTVDISLEGNPPGMTLKPLSDDGKEAELSWCPSRDQISQQKVYSFNAVADDHDHPAVKQRMSVVIRLRDGGGPQPGCAGEPPTIITDGLYNQDGDNDYAVEAQISDAESEIQQAFVAFTWTDPQDADSYLTAEMVDTGGGKYLGAIPNISKMEDADRSVPVRVYYYFCALDNDDADGEPCDKSICEPMEFIFPFTVCAEGVAGCGDEGEGAAVCPDDANEPNDGSAAAGPIPDNNARGLVLCPDDEDWYTVDTHAGDDLTVRAFFLHRDGNLALQVLDPGGQVAGRADTESDVEVVTVEGTLAGTYLVGVTGTDVGTSGATYDLAVETAAGGAGECLQDANEPNNAAADATSIGPGNHGPFGLCGADDSDDWYVIELQQGATISATASFQHSAGDLDMELHRAGQRLTKSDTVTDDEHFEFTAQETGSYQLRVLAYAALATNSYRLEVGVEGGGGDCANDSGHEPNDTADQAAALDGDVPCARLTADGGQSEEDWYRVTLDASEGLRFNLLFTHSAEGDIDLTMYGPEPGQRLKSSASFDDNEVVEFPGTATEQAWYFKVYGFRGSQNDYRIELERFPFGPGNSCLSDRMEPNNEQGRARTLFLVDESKVLDGLSLCADEDWFRVLVPEGKSFLSTITPRPGGDALDMVLLDDAGEPVGNHDVGGDRSVSVDIDQPGTYFLKVTAEEAGSNLYKLEAIFL